MEGTVPQSFPLQNLYFLLQTCTVASRGITNFDKLFFLLHFVYKSFNFKMPKVRQLNTIYDLTLRARLHLNNVFLLSISDDWIYILVIHGTLNVRPNVASFYVDF